MQGSVCLNNLLLMDQCAALNVESSNELKSVLSSTSSIKSNEDDPQIIIILKFNQNVNMTHIQIESGKNKETNPSNVKLFYIILNYTLISKSKTFLFNKIQKSLT